MRIQANCGQVTKLYDNVDAIFGLLKVCRAKNVKTAAADAEKAFKRIQNGETVKMDYCGTAIYLRQVQS